MDYWTSSKDARQSAKQSAKNVTRWTVTLLFPSLSFCLFLCLSLPHLSLYIYIYLYKYVCVCMCVRVCVCVWTLDNKIILIPFRVWLHWKLIWTVGDLSRKTLKVMQPWIFPAWIKGNFDGALINGKLAGVYWILRNYLKNSFSFNHCSHPSVSIFFDTFRLHKLHEVTSYQYLKSFIIKFTIPHTNLIWLKKPIFLLVFLAENYSKILRYFRSWRTFNQKTKAKLHTISKVVFRGAATIA